MINNLYFTANKNKYKTKQHIDDPMWNTRQDYETGKLWLFDNEYSFYTGYEPSYIQQYSWQYWYHERLLKSICIFRQQTINLVSDLASRPSPADYLLQYIRRREPLYEKMEHILLLERNTRKKFMSKFKDRLNFVLAWVNYCSRI